MSKPLVQPSSKAELYAIQQIDPDESEIQFEEWEDDGVLPPPQHSNPEIAPHLKSQILSFERHTNKRTSERIPSAKKQAI